MVAEIGMAPLLVLCLLTQVWNSSTRIHDLANEALSCLDEFAGQLSNQIGFNLFFSKKKTKNQARTNF